jgi:hypothetical protein
MRVNFKISTRTMNYNFLYGLITYFSYKKERLYEVQGILNRKVSAYNG